MPSDSLPPGPRTPALWQLLRFGTDFIGTLEACARRYGDVFTVTGGRPRSSSSRPAQPTHRRS